MATKTRYVVIYESDDPTKTATISFGVKTETKAHALTRTREFIYEKELHDDSNGYDYTLIAEPSTKPALYEIPSDEVIDQSEQEIVYEDY